jgi:hypothetical protein
LFEGVFPAAKKKQKQKQKKNKKEKIRKKKVNYATIEKTFELCSTQLKN